MTAGTGGGSGVRRDVLFGLFPLRSARNPQLMPINANVDTSGIPVISKEEEVVSR
jgi:hypothetical protein